MWILERYYKSKGKPVPYYAKYSFWMICWRPIRKYINVVIIPNTPFNGWRIGLYRMLGYKIGKKVFIGMKCYMDDLEPSHTRIGNNVTISYGCYFALHGKGQKRNYITIKDGAYIGMRANLIARNGELVIGEKAIIGACSMVNKSVEPQKTVVGIPAKSIE